MDRSERHYIGQFNILNGQIDGEIVYDTETGKIFLSLAKKLGDKELIGKGYAKIAVISGQTNTGAAVTLYNNRCINNYTQLGQTQSICFVSDYFIMSKLPVKNNLYNEMVCTLKNAFMWSQLSIFETNSSGIKVKEKVDEFRYSWFGSEIKFSVFTNETFSLPLEDEEKTIVQRVKLSIASQEKKSIEDMMSIRDKVVAMISFAIRDNINVIEEYFLNYDDSHFVVDTLKEYRKYYLFSGKRKLEIYGNQLRDYNFTLNELPTDKDINDTLEKLVPVFNLYLSLFKYRDMPKEMVFLNIVQALETFHSRFFYKDKKEKYVKSVMDRFSRSVIFDDLKKKLLSDTQMDENCKYIILVSRINDLLIGHYNTLFVDYWRRDDDYGQTIADTRHYYTHYGKAKEKKALKGDSLADAIFVLRNLLEYHICLVLGIDIEEKISNNLKSFNASKQLEISQMSDKRDE